jgi:ATP-dependent protease HslVU (ClpYQ) ATPase subunit
MSKPYQPKTGQACGCRQGVQRDNCPLCEGTGQIIDFAAIRARDIVIKESED